MPSPALAPRESERSTPPLPRAIHAALWTLLAIYCAARVLQLFPAIPLPAMVALHVFPALAFALVHGAMAYRLRGILTFCAISFFTGSVFENLSILTGFPFGHYHFTGVMGPKLFLVPITLGLAYLGIGYLAFVAGRLIVLGPERPITGRSLVFVPMVAAAAMLAWDVSQEPLWSTVLGCWIWHNGGAYFGAPLSNFAGWYLTNYVICQWFTLAQRGRSSPALPSAYWRLAVAYYAACMAGNALVMFTPPPAPLVTDAAGVSWSVAGITRACALASLFAMGPFALLAGRRTRG